MTALLLLWYSFCDRNQNINCQQPDAILIIRCEMLKQRNHLLYYNGSWHAFDKLGKIVRCLSPDHGCIIVNKRGEGLSQPFLVVGCCTLVRGVVEACGGDFGGEPVGF